MLLQKQLNTAYSIYAQLVQKRNYFRLLTGSLKKLMSLTFEFDCIIK